MPDPPLPGAPVPGERRAVACDRCGHPLYDAVSRALRRGPECRTEEFAARSGEVAQDVLPGLDVTPSP